MLADGLSTGLVWDGEALRNRLRAFMTDLFRRLRSTWPSGVMLSAYQVEAYSGAGTLSPDSRLISPHRRIMITVFPSTAIS